MLSPTLSKKHQKNIGKYSEIIGKMTNFRGLGAIFSDFLKH
jgi:hypothetical protein